MHKTTQCCEKCFADPYIQSWVREKAVKGSCEFCGESEVYVCRLHVISSKIYDCLCEHFHNPEEFGLPVRSLYSLISKIRLFSKTLPPHTKKLLLDAIIENAVFQQTMADPEFENEFPFLSKQLVCFEENTEQHGKYDLSWNGFCQ